MGILYHPTAIIKCLKLFIKATNVNMSVSGNYVKSWEVLLALFDSKENVGKHACKQIVVVTVARTWPILNVHIYFVIQMYDA